MICTWRKSLRWKAKAYSSLPKFLEEHPGYRFLFLTLTVKNCEVNELRCIERWGCQSRDLILFYQKILHGTIIIVFRVPHRYLSRRD